MRHSEMTAAWDVARAASERVDLAAEPSYDFAAGAEWGAGWAFAIIGMAQAIADRQSNSDYNRGFVDGYDTRVDEWP